MTPAGEADRKERNYGTGRSREVNEPALNGAKRCACVAVVSGPKSVVYTAYSDWCSRSVALVYAGPTPIALRAYDDGR